MSGMKSWMLGAAMGAGALGMGTTAGLAAEWGYHERGPVAYVPPCPGPGYIWIAGYMAGGYWVPGRWDYRPVARPMPFRVHRGERGWDRDRRLDYDRDRDGERWRR